MSRASPLPRSGDRSKAVMVGVIGRLLAVGGIVITGGRAVKGTRSVIAPEKDLPRSASTIVAQPVLEARTSGALDPAPPHVRCRSHGVRPGGPRGADTAGRAPHVGAHPRG